MPINTAFLFVCLKFFWVEFLSKGVAFYTVLNVLQSMVVSDIGRINTEDIFKEYRASKDM